MAAPEGRPGFGHDGSMIACGGLGWMFRVQFDIKKGFHKNVADDLEYCNGSVGLTEVPPPPSALPG
jgi:hypothetical protein